MNSGIFFVKTKKSIVKPNKKGVSTTYPIVLWPKFITTKTLLIININEISELDN